MKVRELIEALQALKNQDMEVILQGDPEGNDYSYIAGVDHECWTAQVATGTYDDWTVPVSSESLDEAAKDNDTELGEYVQCVVIFPANRMKHEADLGW